MEERRLVHISKYLSKHLRHQPERLGLTLAPGGWVTVDALLAAAARHNMPITRAELDEVVVRNDKQRFSFDPTGTLIRANQGHSVPVDLELAPLTPPDLLYHGTGQQTAVIIRREGLRKMQRHHVHLSADVKTATAVGARHGRPVVFVVDAACMHRDGFAFCRSANGVWLADRVPPEYLTDSTAAARNDTEDTERAAHPLGLSSPVEGATAMAERDTR
jgi:putative RNA 2'-phosphotransferase